MTADRDDTDARAILREHGYDPPILGSGRRGAKLRIHGLRDARGYREARRSQL